MDRLLDALAAITVHELTITDLERRVAELEGGLLWWAGLTTLRTEQRDALQAEVATLTEERDDWRATAESSENTGLMGALLTTNARLRRARTRTAARLNQLRRARRGGAL